MNRSGTSWMIEYLIPAIGLSLLIWTLLVLNERYHLL